MNRNIPTPQNCMKIAKNVDKNIKGLILITNLKKNKHNSPITYRK